MALGRSAQSLRVVEGGVDVVDAARTHDHQQAVVEPVQDRVDLVPTMQDHLGLVVAQRQLVQQRKGRAQRLHALDPLVPYPVCGRRAQRHPVGLG